MKEKKLILSHGKKYDVMYSVEFYKQAARYYNKLDSKTQRRINKAVDEMIQNPLEGSHIKKVKGRLEGKYRYDIGALRIIYFVAMKNEMILLMQLAHEVIFTKRHPVYIKT